MRMTKAAVMSKNPADGERGCFMLQLDSTLPANALPMHVRCVSRTRLRAIRSPSCHHHPPALTHNDHARDDEPFYHVHDAGLPRHVLQWYPESAV